MRDLLEIHAFNYLCALRDSQPNGNFDHPNVYFYRGILKGICATKEYYFEEDKYWKITFFKRNEKPWFTYTFPGMTEEDADNFVEYRDRQFREAIKSYKKFFE
jgi:hypothetical protein